MSDDVVVINVPSNRYSIEPVTKTRPYMSTEDGKRRWLEFNSVIQAVLEGRIDELNGRYKQIVAILHCKENELYLVDADLSSSSPKTSYFYDWLYWLSEVKHVAVADRKTWDAIEMNVQSCLGIGMSFEDSVAIAAHGKSAIDRLERAGAIVRKSKETNGQLYFERGPKADEIMGEGTPVDSYLSEVANTTRSSRGAALRVNSDIGILYHKYTAWVDSDNREEGEWKVYHIEVEEINPKTGEKVPYKAKFMVEKDSPPSVAKAALKTMVGESMSRVAFW